MSNKFTFFCVLFCVFSLNCLAQSETETNKGIRTAGVLIPRPADEGKIQTLIPDYELEDTSLEYIQSLPAPGFKFVFTAKNLTFEPNDEIKEVINAHWKEALKFFYEDKFNKPALAQDAYNKDVAWFNYCQKTHKNFKEIMIEAPLGKRNISETESTEFWATLNEVAVQIIKKVREKKDNF